MPMRDKRFWFCTLLILGLGGLAWWLAQTPAPLPLKPGAPVQIVGRVVRPGMCAHQEGLTLAKALEEGGQGLATFADKRRVRILNSRACPEARYKPLLRGLANLLDSVEAGLYDMLDWVDLGHMAPDLSGLDPGLPCRATVDLQKQQDFVLLPGDVVIVPEKTINL